MVHQKAYFGRIFDQLFSIIGLLDGFNPKQGKRIFNSFGAGCQIWPILKIEVSDPQKWSKMSFFGVLRKTKVARNQIVSEFDFKKSTFGGKLTI